MPPDKSTLRQFTPLDSLSHDNFREIAAKAVFEKVPGGQYLCKEGEVDKQAIYLLEGEVELISGDAVARTVSAGTGLAKHPLAHEQPRAMSVRTRTPVTVARVDRDLLDILLTWDQSVAYEVSELSDEPSEAHDDWMARILQTKAFHRVPAANIQAMFLRMAPVHYAPGEIVMRQGDEGDYFYIVKDGRCQVIRTTTRHPDGVVLAELGVGDTFGEEALISHTRRNATVRMVTAGVLMRLAKADFLNLLKEPLLARITYAEAAALVAGGRAVWLDVRLPSEHEKRHIRGSVNIPLYFLRNKLGQLDPKQRYVVYCDTGRRSSAAVYLLNERGLNAYLLEEGLAGVAADA
jgi:CRP-like cAMP-binding protein